MSQIQIETFLTAPILILTQVGRKVAQVLESLGRSAETIQEGEARKTPLIIFLDQYFCHLHKSQSTRVQVRRFCKESRNLRVQRGSKISEEFNQPSNREWWAGCSCQQIAEQNFRCDPDLGSDRLYYLALRAVDRYCDQWGADPGAYFKVWKFNFEAGMTESDIEVDIGRLKTIAASLLTGLGLNNNPQVAYHSLN